MMSKIKICGIQSRDALEAALGAGADYIGLVFFEKSPRNLELQAAAELADVVRERGPHSPAIVALLVDPGNGQVDDVVERVKPDVIQLHGQETVGRVKEIRARSHVKLWKAVGVATRDDVLAAKEYRRQEAADQILFDAKPPTDSKSLPGGNGLTFDWRILAGESQCNDFILAGGLTPDNVADAIRLLSPSVVDVSSGVERQVGEKDAALIRDFIEAARSANQSA